MVARTWILTGSPENYEATKARGFTVIGLKERNRNRALEIDPGDRIVLYVTRVMAFAGSIRVDGALYEDRSKIWPGKPGKADSYPWRFETSPEVVLEPPEVVAAIAWSTKRSKEFVGSGACRPPCSELMPVPGSEPRRSTV